MNLGIIAMLVVVAGVLGGVRHLLHLPDPARRQLARSAEAVATADRRKEGLVMLNSGCRSQASTHAAEIDQMIGARALADAGAVRRLGRLLPLRAVPLPQGRESDGELRRREGQDREGHRDRASRRSKWSCSSFYAIPAWATRVEGVPGGERSGRRPRRRRAVRVERPLSRARTARSAAPTIKLVSRRQSARARSRRCRRRRTTSPPSTS